MLAPRTTRAAEPNPRASSARALLASVLALGLVAACSGGSEGALPSGGGSVPDPTRPDGASTTTCATYEECPSFPCACGDGVVNGRLCVDGYCLNEAKTCASVCGDEEPVSGSSSGGSSSGGSSSGGSTDPATAAPGDPCVPISSSGIVPRVGAIAAILSGHMQIPATPANGNVNVTRNSAGKPTYISYDATGTSADYTDSITYNSKGDVTYFSHDAAGTSADYTDSITYNSKGLPTYFSHDAAGTSADYTESLTYNSAGLMTYFSHDAAGTSADFTESFTYNSSGLVTYFSHDAAGTSGDHTESFTYNSAGLCTYWKYDGAGSDDGTVSVSYNSSGNQTNLSTNGARASGTVVTRCP